MVAQMLLVLQELLILVAVEVVQVAQVLSLAVQVVAEQLSSHTLAHKNGQAEL
jgi:hypothetical protein